MVTLVRVNGRWDERSNLVCYNPVNDTPDTHRIQNSDALRRGHLAWLKIAGIMPRLPEMMAGMLVGRGAAAVPASIRREHGAPRG